MRHHDHRNFYKTKYLIESGLCFRGLFYYLHGSKQAGMVLEKWLGVLHPDCLAAGETLGLASVFATPKSTASGTLPLSSPHFLIAALPMSLWGTFLFKPPFSPWECGKLCADTVSVERLFKKYKASLSDGCLCRLYEPARGFIIHGWPQ